MYCQCTVQHDPVCCYAPQPPSWCPGGGGGGGGGGNCGSEDCCVRWDCSCDSNFDCATSCGGDGYCTPWIDPIIVDVAGNGFQLTDAANGVNFDFFANSRPRHIAWTAAGVDDAWLVLDRNGNGGIDSGAEMFSNVTPPVAPAQIGFEALARNDAQPNGGNGDGVIDQNDAIFFYLRLWQDVNHNGISEPSELHTLPELGLKSIDLDYKQSRRTDQFGNQFRYRAKVRDTHGAQLGRWAWDVVLKQK